jgi:probable HAF family extracellular repeat protein
MHLTRNALALSLSILAAASAFAAPPKYSATKLPLDALAINNSNTVVGVLQVTSNTWQAAVWTATDGVKALGTLGGKYSEAYAITDTGEIVGQSQTSDRDYHAFLYKNGKMTDLGALDGGESTALSVNSRGVICGYSRTADGDDHAVYWDAKGIHDLGALKGGTQSQAIQISPSSRIVGNSDLGDPDVLHAFIALNGRSRLIFNRDVESQANGINRNAHITGSFINPDGDEHAYYDNGVKAADLGTLGQRLSRGVAINQSNDIVGQTDVTDKEYIRAFVWTGGKMYDLNDLLTAPIANPLDNGVAITNKGWILATTTGDEYFLLKPVK